MTTKVKTPKKQKDLVKELDALVDYAPQVKEIALTEKQFETFKKFNFIGPNGYYYWKGHKIKVAP